MYKYVMRDKNHQMIQKRTATEKTAENNNIRGKMIYGFI